MQFADGSTGETMHNAYPTLYHRTTRRVVDALRARAPAAQDLLLHPRRVLRTAGIGRLRGRQLPGRRDHRLHVSSGLPSIVPDMLNRAVGGAGDSPPTSVATSTTCPAPSTEELFTRWHQAAALTPYFRVHNSSSTGVKMPWDFGPTALARFRRMSQLHAQALPYLRRLQRRSPCGPASLRRDPCGSRSPTSRASRPSRTNGCSGPTSWSLRCCERAPAPGRSCCPVVAGATHPPGARSAVAAESAFRPTWERFHTSPGASAPRSERGSQSSWAACRRAR